MKAPFLILILALFSSLACAAPAPKATPVPLDRLIALVDQADAQRNEALAKVAKAEKSVADLTAWGLNEYERAEAEKTAKEKYKGSRIAFFGSGFVLGGFILLLVGLAVGSGVLARLKQAGHDGSCAASPALETVVEAIVKREPYKGSGRVTIPRKPARRKTK